MNDDEFFSELYRLWSKTTWAENGYWMPEEVVNVTGQYKIYAVDECDRKLVASFLSDEDADFITAMHGALPDLIRQLHDSRDEAERKDEENDIAQGHLADVLLENQALRAEIQELEKGVE